MEKGYSETEQYAVVVAGGTGTRMGGGTPKQFLEIGGKPIVMHTLSAFHRTNQIMRLVLVLPHDSVGHWMDVVERTGFGVLHHVVAGGETRFQSVKKGLAMVPDSALVAVHDGVRPFVAPAAIEAAFVSAFEKGSGVLAVPLKDSIRQLGADGQSRAADRAAFMAVQTPQVFWAGPLKRAYEKAGDGQGFTDDASVAEQAGIGIHLTAGSYRNIKITTPEDLALAETLSGKDRR